MPDPDKCRANNPHWKMGRGSKGSANTPYEVSQMRDINPCKTCQVRKHCHENTSPHLYMKKPKYVKTHQAGRNLQVKGELINAKRQVGLSFGLIQNRTPRYENVTGETKHPEPKYGIVKVQYGRTADRWKPHDEVAIKPDTSKILADAQIRWADLKRGK